MAEPLTSSDIIRERMGFGVSPLASMETRRSYAAAGLSPLGTQERERFERGGGISPMATEQEKEAWKQAEFMAGSREQAPVSYGGIGDRPIGTSRRAIRMQAEWDKQQEQQLEQQKIIQQMDLQQKEYEMQKRDQFLQENEFYYNRGLKEAEQKLQAEQRSQATNIIGALNQLDPRDPDYRKKVGDIFAKNPLGAADDGALKVAEKYGTANELYMSSLETQSEQRKKDAEEQAKIQADIVKYDLTPEQQSKMLVSNLPAGVIMFDPNKAKPIIAEAEKAIEATKETKVKEKESATRFDDYNKALAAYEGLSGDKMADPEAIAKARSEVRGAAAVLRIPKVNSEEDLQNYQSGDKVLAPDGITIITVP